MHPRLVVIDAFTRIPGSGNRAGVYPDAGHVDEASMQRAAAAVAASETAFVLPPPDGASVRLRYFTPQNEIAFCGHATVATFHWLVESGALAAPASHVLDCPAGRVEIDLEVAEGGVLRVWMATPRYPWEPSPIAGATLLGLFGGSQSMRDQALPIERSGSHLYVAIAKRADLWSLAPRWDALAAEGERFGIRGYYVFTRDVLEPGSVTHGRYFVPALGIREDPVTGSASGPLAEYLVRHGVLPLPTQGGSVRGRAEQGDAMGKPGRVELEVRGAAGAIEAVRVGGQAITVLDGRLLT